MRPCASLFVTLCCGTLLTAGCGLFDHSDGDGIAIDPGSTITPHDTSKAALRTYSSCEDLLSSLRSSLSEQMRVTLEQQIDMYRYGGPMLAEDDAGGGPVATADSSGGTGAADGAAQAANTGREEGVDFSGTNNQETGVDEADFVKTDGNFIYALNGGRLEIFAVPEYGELVHRSSTPIEGYPSQMLQAEDRAVVLSRVSAGSLTDDDPLHSDVLVDNYGGWYRVNDLTKLTVLDITDRGAPQILRELYVEGNYQTAREVGGSARVVSHAFMEIQGLRYWVEMPEAYWQLDYDSPAAEAMRKQAVEETVALNDQLIAEAPLSSFIPQIYERQGDAIVTHPFTNDGCASFNTAQDSASRGVTSILSLNLFDTAFTFDADHIVTNWAVVYASADTMIIAEPSHDGWWYWENEEFEVMTNIHRFDIATPGQTVYTGSGRVLGTINDQFSLSVHEGLVRVASTTDQWNRWWMENPPPTVNHIFVLEGENALEEVGHLDNIAEGERIWASRFVGNRAFLVTFRNIDPLFTIDLSNKNAPQIMGELKVPGVSTYIHPINEDFLLTIGYGGDDDGLDWNVQVSLFDVSDFGDPKEAARLPLSPAPNQEDGWQHSWSEAVHEHKAFLYWAPKGLLAVPLSSWRYLGQRDANGEYWERWEHSSRLQLISVDPDADAQAGESLLSPYGEVDHSGFFADLSCHWGWLDVRRSIFMQDYVYALSDRGVTAHHLDDLTTPTAQSALSGMADLYDYEWCW